MAKLSDKERYQVAVNARLCGARNGSVLVLDDGSRWKLSGLTVVPADTRRIYTGQEDKANG